MLGEDLPASKLWTSSCNVIPKMALLPGSYDLHSERYTQELERLPSNTTSLKQYSSQTQPFEAMDVFENRALNLWFVGKTIPSVQPQAVNELNRVWRIEEC